MEKVISFPLGSNLCRLSCELYSCSAPASFLILLNIWTQPDTQEHMRKGNTVSLQLACRLYQHWTHGFHQECLCLKGFLQTACWVDSGNTYEGVDAPTQPVLHAPHSGSMQKDVA